MKTLTNTNAIDYMLADDNRALLHVVNCKSVMASGIALEIKNRIPEAYKEYLKANQKLGNISFGGRVVNLYAQDLYGIGRRQLNYGALSACFSYFKMLCENETFEIVIPYLMGCDRAGGDWEVVMELIEFGLSDFNVTICAIGDVK
jgi:hypothetical protein